MKMLVTGGAGFIGSAFVRYVITHQPDVHVITVDKLTYAGNLENLAPVDGHPRHQFIRGDVCDVALITALLGEQRFDAIVHFAAESHVDRSILSARDRRRHQCAWDRHGARCGAGRKRRC